MQVRTIYIDAELPEPIMVRISLSPKKTRHKAEMSLQKQKDQEGISIMQLSKNDIQQLRQLRGSLGTLAEKVDAILEKAEAPARPASRVPGKKAAAKAYYRDRIINKKAAPASTAQ